MMPSISGLKGSYVRSSSKISIYNYPDHLNPFYEEDNHKRLRFWKISQPNENSKRSFSIGNLRDIWNFRSFNLKKKSSTLGIQKTSESPPTMRRNLESTLSAIHPKENTSENRRPIMRSLQNVNAPIGISSSKVDYPYYQGITNFGRRSTSELPQHLIIRSSYSSLSSSNPFESDIESDANSIGTISAVVHGKSYRKKRKAPLAPIQNMIMMPCIDTLKGNTIDTCQSSRMEAKQDIDTSSYSNEMERISNQENVTTATNLASLGSCTDYDGRPSNKVCELLSEEKSLDTSDSIYTGTKHDIDIKSLTTEIERFVNNRIENSNNRSVTLGSSTELDTRRNDAMDISLPDNSENTNQIFNHTHSYVTKTESFAEMSAPNIDDLTTSKQVDNNLQDNKLNSNNILIETTAGSNQNNSMECKCNYENNYIAESSEMLNKQLTIFEQAERKPPNFHEKPVKIKSVKDIIDSINRSQQLLKDSAAKGTTVFLTSSYLKNNIIPIVDHNRHSQIAPNCDSNGCSYSKNHLAFQQNDFKKNKIHKIVFQCRESSPTASNLDWNPLPKPKRINSDFINKD